MRPSHSRHCSYAFVYVYMLVLISYLVLLTSNRLWAHHASEVPRELIPLTLWSGSWGVGVLEHWRCPRVHFVVVSVYLSFTFAWMYVWYKSVWLECLDYREVYLRRLEVLRLQKHLTWVFWVFKGLFEIILLVVELLAVVQLLMRPSTSFLTCPFLHIYSLSFHSGRSEVIKCLWWISCACGLLPRLLLSDLRYVCGKLPRLLFGGV